MKISLITVSFNAEATIADAMESVCRQKLPEGVELEYIVVDGASKDGTVEKIKAFAEKMSSYASFRLCQGYGGQVGGFEGEKWVGGGEGLRNFSFRWVSEKDEGLYDAMNKGIRMSTGEVVGILNADDVLADDETIAKIARSFTDDVEAVYGDIRFVRDVSGVEAMRSARVVRYCTGKFFRKWMFRFGTFPAHPSTFVRREMFEKHGLYSLEYSICADFEMMLRLFVKHGIRAKYMGICTTVMRTGGASTAGLRSNLEINRQDLRALRANGVWSCLGMIYLKYLGKVFGYIRR